METKIQQQHKAKFAYIYLRQSSMGQVWHNQESTERQYALQNKAHQLGWDESAIKILDGDLGISGSHTSNREDFKILIADVSMGKVGAVFALEASRLSRSCTDWHRLLELCALTGTLIIDEDGCYNPSDFNDQLLLGLKGTMSQAELHFIRARLLGGKVNKAKKGELRFPLPVGFCYDDQGRIIFDKDEQVRHVVKLLFKVFREKGSAYAVAHYFGGQKIQFPKRAYGGIWKGKLFWGPLTHSRVVTVLKNPSYAGTYVYGRYKYQKNLSADGNLRCSTITLPMDEWQIVIKDHHDGYITWEEYLENKETLKSNQTNTEVTRLPGPAREGLALLQGLLICGSCGHRASIRYKNCGKVCPRYECHGKKRDGISTKTCLSVLGSSLDQAVVQKVLEVIEPAQINIAIEAFETLKQQHLALDKQWQMKITRAEYESQLAQRRYEEVDPNNRLVASTLEKDWNNALIALEEVRSQYANHQQKKKLSVAIKHKDDILSLAHDLPRLWQAPSTNAKDRKRILRLLIKDITVEKLSDEKKVILHICWQGGATEDLVIELPKPSHQRWKHPPALIEQVRQLAKNMADQRIVEKFNREGMKTNKGNSFSVYSIRWIRFKHGIASYNLQKPGELSVNQVAEKFGVSHYVVRYWIEYDIIKARRVHTARLWIPAIDPEKEIELENWVKNSTKIAKAKQKAEISLKATAGGAL